MKKILFYSLLLLFINSNLRANGSARMVLLPPPPLATTDSASFITAVSATLFGLIDDQGVETTITFEYGLTSAYGLVANALPSSLPPGSGTTIVSANISGLTPNTIYHFRVTAVNADGITNGLDGAFTTFCTDPVPIITGGDSICENSSGIIYTTEAGMSGYVWTIVGNASIVSGQGTESLTLDFAAAGTDSISVTYVDANGCSPAEHTVFTVVVDSALGTLSTILGEASISIPSIGIMYSVIPLDNAANYTWSVLQGASIVRGQGTPIIVVDFSALTTLGSISVVASNSCGSMVPSLLAISIAPPAAAGTIFSPTNSSNVCIGSSGNTYMVDPILNAANYVWSVPSGAVIESGQGTPMISVSYPLGAVSGNVSVYGSNITGNGAPSSFAVSINTLPNSPSITGNSIVCQQSYEIYETELGMYSYDWNVIGGEIVFILGHRITVLWQEAGMQSVRVNYANANGCGADSASVLSINVGTLPNTVEQIRGSFKICTPQMGVAYTVDSILSAINYEWVIPSGATIVSGTGTSHIIVDFGANAQSGNISVRAINDCGFGNFSPIATIDASPIPEAPVISKNGDVLSTNYTGNGTFQWYLDGVEIPNANSATFSTSLSGNYQLVVILNGCESPMSNSIAVTLDVNSNHIDSKINLYPTPNNGEFTISFETSKEIEYSIEIFSAIGSLEYKSPTFIVNGKLEKQINLQGKLSAGLYNVRISSSDWTFIKKMIISK